MKDVISDFASEIGFHFIIKKIVSIKWYYIT